MPVFGFAALWRLPRIADSPPGPDVMAIARIIQDVLSPSSLKSKKIFRFH
jgi:hypothetical protein